MKRSHVAAPASVQELMDVTGLGRDAVRAGIRCGQLPGYVVGVRYIVPRQAFEAFCRGDWEPTLRMPIPGPIRIIRDISEVA